VARSGNQSIRFLPHALAATFVVMVVPSLTVAAIGPSSSLLLVLLSVAIAMGASVALATLGSACWTRHPASQDVVFGDLMLWGWLRKVHAERRLDKASALLDSDGLEAEAHTLSGARRCEILQQLAGLLDASDSFTHGHSRRVTRHAERIAREMGLPPDQVTKIRVAAALHDVGKVHTPREVLTKPGRLSAEEFAIIKRHPVDGAEMVAEIGDAEITAMVRHHHERLDGTGYPDGLAQEEIPLGARVIAVADTFDAMTSSRPYRRATKHRKALDVLSTEAGSQLDPAPVAAFMRYYTGKRSVGWSAFIVTAPPRLATWIGGPLQGAGAGMAPLAQGVVAAGLVALAGASLGGVTHPASAAAERTSQHELSRDVDRVRAADHAKTADESRGTAERRGARHRDDRPPGQRELRRRADSEGRSGHGGGDGPPAPDGPSGPVDGGQSGSTPDETDRPDDPTPTPTPSGDDVPTIRVRVDVEVAGIGVPEVEVPNIGMPDVDVPGIELSGVEVPGADLPNVGSLEVRLPRL
jgi:putative nucleotidyltransferase with HDIG domain